jgi:hypothetical protein
MEWFSQNWVWVLIFVAFIAMHLFGHGGHGGHGGRSDGADKNSKPVDKDDLQRTSKPSGHQH